MKKTVIKSCVIAAIFLTALLMISAVMNKGNTDMTMEMGKATYPVVYAVYNGETINEMHGYADQMEVANMREHITPLADGRKVMLKIERYEREITGISFEVRNLNGSRLIENTEVTDFSADKEEMSLSFTLKDLIEADQEYVLVLLLTLDQGETVRYYTRVIASENNYLEEKLDFIREFSTKTFDREAAKDLTKYLESNAEGDNTTFGRVTIHSSFNQLTWGELGVKREMEPQIIIKELSDQTGSFLLKYYVSVNDGKKDDYYEIKESFRVRYTKDRMYLLEYERIMNQVFEESEASIINNKISLGITGENNYLKESDGGSVIVFVTGNRLYSYNTVDNKLAYLFGFYNYDNLDNRSLYDKHKIKVLNLDEAGNVTFMVYGYMNRGRHEGETGITVNYYDSTVNTVEEMVYVPYEKSPDLLMAEVDQLSYINKTGTLYLMLDNQIYGINAVERTGHVVVKNMMEGCYKVSEDSQMIVWQAEGGLYQGNELILMNLNTGKQTSIKAQQGEVIAPIGFMGNDLIYGLARNADIVKDHSGGTLFPMYCVKIQNELEGILKVKEYKEDIFITAGTVAENQIILSRVSRNEAGEYEIIDDAQITNVQAELKTQNMIEEVAIDKFEKVTQIVLKSQKKESAIKILTPREVLFEGNRTVYLNGSESQTDRFYVYGINGIDGIFMDAGNAVKMAYDRSDVVINDSGNYVWLKGNRSLRNQIMAISGETQTEEKDSLSICLDTILSYEGVIRNSEYLLKKGDSAQLILENNLENMQVLDLTGCSLDAMLYYVNKDIPVLVMMQDGSAMLLIGFNEMNTVVMDPKAKNPVYKIGLNDSKELFSQNGNCFITYVKNED